MIVAEMPKSDKSGGGATHFVLNEVRYRRPAVDLIAVFGISCGLLGRFALNSR